VEKNDPVAAAWSITQWFDEVATHLSNGSLEGTSLRQIDFMMVLTYLYDPFWSSLSTAEKFQKIVGMVCEKKPRPSTKNSWTWKN
jgi:hypothetical protein